MDLIERQAAIDEILDRRGAEYHNEYECGYDDGLRDAVDWLKRLPSAEPVRMKAKDICDTAYGHCEFKCSACGVEIGVVEGGELDGGYFKFCPNCGADMRGEEDE